MTREENTAKLAQLRSETEALVKDYNDAIQNGKFEDASKADKAMTEKINEYTATVRASRIARTLIIPCLPPSRPCPL